MLLLRYVSQGAPAGLDGTVDATPVEGLCFQVQPHPGISVARVRPWTYCNRYCNAQERWETLGHFLRTK